MGDGGGSGDPERTAQDPDSPLGKLLRIDRDRAGDYELAAIGLRNPWRFSFDRQHRRALDRRRRPVDALEEIDAVPLDELGRRAQLRLVGVRGDRAFNGDQQAPGALEPVLAYGRDRGCSVTGGYVVRDPELPTLVRPLPLRRLLRGRAAQLHRRPGEAGRRRQAARPAGPLAELVWRGQRRSCLRGLARRARLPADAGLGMRPAGGAGAAVAAVVVAVAILTAAAGASAAPRPSGVGLRQIGRFEQPVYVTQAPGEPRTVYVVEQQGQVIARAQGPEARAAVPRPHRPGPLRPGRDAVAGGRDVLDRVRSATTPTTAASTSSTPAPKGNNFIDEYGAPGPAVAPTPLAAPVLRSPPLRRLPQRRPAAVRARRHALDVERRRRLLRGPRRPVAQPRDPARQAAADRSAAPTAATVSAGNPLLGSPGPTRSTPRACATRGASRSTADRQPGARRRRRQRAAREEIDYLSPSRRAARTSAGPSTRASTSRPGAPGPGTPIMPIFTYRHTRPLRDHRRLRRPRPEAAAAVRPLPLRRFLRRPHPQPRPAGARRRPPTRRARHRRPRRGPLRPSPELVRRGARRADLRRLAGRARLPARAPAGKLGRWWVGDAGR